jgi:biotin operon repressor
MWVKEDIKAVLMQWNTKTTKQLSDELGCSEAQIMYIANQARKLGYDLPKKHKNGVVQNLLREVIAEIK